MIDFLLTNTGDMVLRGKTNRPSLTLTTKRNNHPMLIVTGRYEKVQAFEDTPYQGKKPLTISMLYADVSNPKEATTIRHDEEIRQRLAILLRTELGDLRHDKTFGTLLYTKRHEDITNQETLDALTQIIEEAVKKILEKAEVSVSVKRSDTAFFAHSLRITIHEDGHVFYQFSIEV